MKQRIQRLGLSRDNQSLVLACLLYASLAVVITWPVSANLGTKLAGFGDDVWSHQWTFNWIKDSLLSSQSPYFTELIFFPVGVSLATHNIAWLHILAWIPLQAIVGPITAYNLILIAILAFNGLAMYLFSSQLTNSRMAAFVAGLVFAFWPYALSQHDHPNMIFLAWIPLTLLFMKRTVEGRRMRDAIFAALFLALTGWARWHLLIMGSVAIVIYGFHLVLSNRSYVSVEGFKKLTLVVSLAGLLMTPIALPIIANLATTDNLEDVFIDEQYERQTDLLAYLVPSNMHALWGTPILQIYEPIYENFAVANQERTPFVGYSVMLLAIIAVFTCWRQTRIWVLIALVYFALSLGPVLRVNGETFPQVPMPYLLVEDFFLIRVLRLSDIFNVVLGLPIAVLVGYGITTLIGRLGSRRLSLLLVAFIGTIILFEYLPVPFPQSDPQTPVWFTALAEDTDDFAILQLPNDIYSFNKHYMYYQITHGKPIVNGKIARVPAEAMSFWNSTLLLRSLAEYAQSIEIPDVSHQLRRLSRESGIRYIVIHKQFANDGQIAVWRDWLTYSPRYEDEELIVYNTDPTVGRDFQIEHMLSDDFGLIRVSYAPKETNHLGTVKVDARWGAMQTTEGDHQACLNLVDDFGEIAQSHCETIAPTWPTSKWEANEVVRDFYVMPIGDNLEPGQYTLTMGVTNETEASAIRSSVELGKVIVHPIDPAHLTEAEWAQQIRLAGYDLEVRANALRLTFYWQALQEMDRSYKYFVHLIDPISSEVVGQIDSVPRAWAYPTNAWEPGETVRDSLSLPLEGIPSTGYELWLGWYDELTQERLPIDASASDSQRDDAILLTTLQNN